MLNNLRPLLFILFFSLFNTLYSQTGFELGLLAGPVQMRSDFGLKGDKATNLGNIGLGVGVMLDINPMDWGGGERLVENYIVDHFKLRFDLTYSTTNLKHYGKFVEPDREGEDAAKLRNQRGRASNFGIGASLEYYPLSLKSFFYEFYDFSPYALLGFQYIYAHPDANTTDPDELYSPWAPGSVNIDAFHTLSLNTGIGVRYKLSEYSDLLLEGKVQFFTSDWIDGLNHQLDYNKNNDALIWINVGYVYYIN